MAVLQTFQSAIVAELKKSNGTKWGVEESLHVIQALLVDETGAPEMFAKNDKDEDSELTKAIREVVNPSQFAQKLENADDPANKGQKMLKRSGRVERTKNALLDFGVK